MAVVTTRYFVAKCDHIKRLYDAKDTAIWACPHRQNPPQPSDILTEAFSSAKVILIFSANNCHGWHGYATMVTKPGDPGDTDGAPVWHRFCIHWEALCLLEHGEQCLPFTKTQDLTLTDGSPLNKVRNLQELNPKTGRILCEAITAHLQALTNKKLSREREKRDKLGEPFFAPTDGNNATEVWNALVSKVNTIGTVLLACAFGSQRYNLHTPSSDVDMFVVYAANTRDILGLGTSPLGTIKNRDTESCDYTIHELSRYCELLLAGDPRCVETLFLHPSCLHCTHPVWEEILQWRYYFLTSQCVEKYLRDATGGKGTRLLDKLTVGQTTVVMTPKLAKLCYIIIRLLQNARDVCHGELHVYREETSEERQLLMDVRAAHVDYITTRGHVDRLLCEIESSKDKISTAVPQEKLHDMLEAWIIKLRFENLKEYAECK